MYLEHFGLSYYPFGVTPDPEFFYLSSCRRLSVTRFVGSLKAGGAIQ